MSGAETITIQRHLRLMDSRWVRDGWNSHWEPSGSLYYFAGNFFWPFLSLHGSEFGRVRGEIRKFMKTNAAMVTADRASQNYMTLPQMMDVKPYNEVPGDCL